MSLLRQPVSLRLLSAVDTAAKRSTLGSFKSYSTTAPVENVTKKGSLDEEVVYTPNKMKGTVLEPNKDHPDYLKKILTSKVYEIVDETACTPGHRLSAKYGCNIVFKREDLQPVYSFKIRGAYNMLANLSPEDRAKGVISCSAGNHAQGVAISAHKLGVPATIVMPVATPKIKYENVKRLGAEVLLYGDNFDAAKAECARLEKERGLTYVAPFDHPDVIAGQGTIGLELLRQLDLTKLKVIFCCVGGGGLAAGIASYVKRIAPHVKIIGVETWDADALHQSLDKGERVTLDEVGLFADGAAVRVVGEECFRICAEHLDGMVHVNTDEICAAINDAFDDSRSILEPAGALSLAGLKKYLSTNDLDRKPDDTYCAVFSGANMNFDRLRFVAERSRLGAGSEVFFAVEMPEKPGMYRQLCDILAPRDVTEFAYRYRSPEFARFYISFTVKDRSEIKSILQKIDATGMKAIDVSDNDVAKTHARYMVGGTPDLPTERLFQFEFPERPGALQRFLQVLQFESNITLFHYRGNGSDIARVLAGIVPGENEDLDKALQQLGYPYVDVTNNEAYQMFLK